MRFTVFDLLSLIGSLGQIAPTSSPAHRGMPLPMTDAVCAAGIVFLV
jgi:hypothetical protein